MLLAGMTVAALPTGLPEPRTVTVVTEGHALNPVFSSGGRYVAFELNDYANRLDLWVQDLRDEGPPRAVPMPGAGPFGGGSAAVGATWYPDNVMTFEAAPGRGEWRLRMYQPGMETAEFLVSLQE